MDRREFLKKFAMAGAVSLVGIGCSGCFVYGVQTVYGPMDARDPNPTFLKTFDAIETSLAAIALAYRMQLGLPLSARDRWDTHLMNTSTPKPPLGLFAKPPEQLMPRKDPETGLPRTSGDLLTSLRKAGETLDKSCDRDSFDYFKQQPSSVISRDVVRPGEKAPLTVYRNALLAYGAVMGQNNEALQLAGVAAANMKKFTEFNAVIRTTADGLSDAATVAKQYSPVIWQAQSNDGDLTATPGAASPEDQSKYGDLATNLYRLAITGADICAVTEMKFSYAALNGMRSLLNIKHELAGGEYDLPAITPRIKNMLRSLGLIGEHLAVQRRIFRMMYREIRNRYQVATDTASNRALRRLETMESVLAEFDPTIRLALAGKPIRFTDAENARLQMLETLFSGAVDAA